MTDPAESPAEPLTPPPEIPAFFRIGPMMLVLGSLSVVTSSLIVAGALQWSNPFAGFVVSAMMTFTFGLPLLIILFVVQSVLGLIFMAGRRRGWWRTSMVLFPAALIVGGCLFSVVNLFPPERRARRELGHHLGGPIPASVRDVQLEYFGGIDPTRNFKFSVSPADYELIKGFRDYSHKYSAPGTLQADIPGYFFYLDYDPAAGRCTYSVLNY